MSLTVSEKEHWKARIEARIDRKIEALYAVDPTLKERVERKAEAAAIESLGLTELWTRIEEIEQNVKQMEREKNELEQTMLVKIANTDDVPRYYGGRSNEVETAVKRRKDVLRPEILGLSRTGKQILRFEKEKENLLDVVWLATSPQQVKDLWATVGLLLDDAGTELEKEALAIPAENALPISGHPAVVAKQKKKKKGS